MATSPAERLTLERDLLTLDDLIGVTGWKKTKTYEDAKAGGVCQESETAFWTICWCQATSGGWP